MALALAAALAWPAASGAAELTVRARTVLSLEARAEGRRLVLTGMLRDNLNQGLADRRVRVALSPLDGDARGRSRRAAPSVRHLVTSADGRFSLVDLLTDGRWSVRAEYEGEALYGASAADAEVVVRRRALVLDLRTPVASPSFARIPVDLTAVETSGPAVDVPISLRVNGRRAAAGLVTDSEGRASGRVDPPARAGTAELEAVFVGSYLYEPTSVRRIVQLYGEAELSLEARVRQRREASYLVLSGRLASDRGPLAGARIEIELPGRTERRWATTGPTGAFDRVEPIDDLEPGITYTASAHFDPHGAGAPDLRISASAAFVVEPGPLAGASRWAGVTALVLLCGTALTLAGLRLSRALARRREARVEVPLPGRAAPAGLVELSPPRPGRAPRETRVSGVVRDADTAVPVGGGEIDVTRGTDPLESLPIATDGSFSAGPLRAGVHRFQFRVHGYVTTTLETEIPHRGRYAGIDVFVCSVRSWVRYLYRQLVVELDVDERDGLGWGRLTPREIRYALVRIYQAFRGPGAEQAGAAAFREAMESLLGDEDRVPSDRVLAALTLLVEEVYYSGRTYTEDMIELCRSLVAGIRQVAGRGEPERPIGVLRRPSAAKETDG